VRTRLRSRVLSAGKPADIDAFLLKLMGEAEEMSEAYIEMSACGYFATAYSRIAKTPLTEEQKEANKDRQRKAGAGGGGALPSGFVCNGCGGKGHKYKDCPKSSHADFNKGRDEWAKSESGKRLKALGKSSISGDAAAGAKQQRGRCNYAHDAPYLAAICANDDSYLIAGSLTGSCDANTINASTTLLPVQVLLDTGAVVDNYCSKAVGVWMRQHFPESWSADSTNEPVALAAVGTATAPLGVCIMYVIPKNAEGTNACILEHLQCTIVDLPVDLIVGRPTIRHKRIVHSIPDYFCEPATPSTHSQLPDALPVHPQTALAADQLLAPTQQPAKPVEGQSRNTGESLTCKQSALLPPGASPLGVVHKQNSPGRRPTP
jgi:hypothetical protein